MEDAAVRSARKNARVSEFHGQPRETLRMRIDLLGGIPPPRWPEGSGVRTFHASDGPRLHALLEHGYRNGGGAVDALGVWLPALIGDSEFDPATCFLVEVGDELAAAAVCWSPGFVKDIVVHETWRRHGLGEALLRLAFATFQARGIAAVELKVHADNASAIRLYERVGMRTVERISGV